MATTKSTDKFDDHRHDVSGLSRIWKYRPKLSLTSLLWLILLCAILLLWWKDHQNLTRQLASFSSSSRNSWSIDQVLGKPDTTGFGDISTAWASSTPDSTVEWIILEFPFSVDSTAIQVHETYNPGAVSQVYAVNFAGKETLLWEGVDPLNKMNVAGGISLITFKKSFQTRRVKLVIDSPSVIGWNEIDAVGLVAADGSIQYASNAWASSSFGSNRKAPGWFMP